MNANDRSVPAGLKIGKFLADKLLNDNLVHLGSQQPLIVVKWKDFTFKQCDKHPERFLFSQNLKQASDYKIESLTVSYVYVAVRVSCANPLNGFEDFVAELFLQCVDTLIAHLIISEKNLICKCSGHVDFNLPPVNCWKVSIKFFEQWQIVSTLLR